MLWYRRSASWITFVLLSLALCTQAQAQNSYSVTQIGVISGMDESQARDINDNGEVAGTFYSKGVMKSCFYWSRTGGLIGIPTPAGNTTFNAVKITNAGEVLCTGRGGYYLWKNGVNGNQCRLFTGLPNTIYASCYDINNVGQAVGRSQSLQTPIGQVSGRPVYPNHPVVWERDAANNWNITDLPLLAGDNAGEAQCLNDNGVLVGTSHFDSVDVSGNTVTSSLHLVRWQKDGLSGAWTVTEIPSQIAGITSYYARYINARGDIAGNYNANAGNFYVSYANPVAVSIGPGAPSSGISGLNASGALTGQVGSSFFTEHAYYWDPSRGPGNYLDLGTLGGSSSKSDWGRRGINNAGVIVGAADTPGNGRIDAFVWDAAHGIRDLNNLTPSKPGFRWLVRSYAINQAGQIVGSGASTTFSAKLGRYPFRAFVLTPQ